MKNMHDLEDGCSRVVCTEKLKPWKDMRVFALHQQNQQVQSELQEFLVSAREALNQTVEESSERAHGEDR